MPGSPRLDMRSQLTRSSLESVASSFKSGLARWRQDARNQDCFYERQDDQDSDLAEESKLLECPPVERSWRAPHMLVYRASVVILLIIVAMLSYFLWTCANNLKDSVIGDLKIQVGNPPKLPIKDVTSEPRKALVIASWSSQNMSWLSELSDDKWEIYRYLLDDPNPSSLLSVPRNQGREAMAYLTFIINHYDILPDFTVFVHGHRRSWHQPEPLPLKLGALNVTALLADNYINLRCARNPGCTEETYISASAVQDGETRIQAKLMPGFWRTMFPEALGYLGMGSPPDAIGVPCCAQFAVSKAAIRLRSLDFWKMYRTPLTRNLSEYETTIGKGLNGYAIGMVYEKLWHIVFGKEAIYCPDEDYCRHTQWSDAITCDRYTGDFDDSIGWENITCTANA